MDKKFATKTNEQRYDIINIIRVILALIIANFHSYQQFFVETTGVGRGGGWLVCDAFFMISGFFLALSIYEKKTPSYWRFCFRKIFRLIPMLLIAWLEGLILSLFLMLINTSKNVWSPIETATLGLWFIWAMWIAEFIFYAIHKYSKKWCVPLTIIISLMSLGVYLYIKILNFNGQSTQWMFWVGGISRGILSVGLGTILYKLAKKINKKFTKNSTSKTIFTIVNVIFIGACVYLMFWQYNTPFIFLVIFLFFAILFICFARLSWLTSSLRMPEKANIFCRKYSLVLYLYQHAFLPFVPILIIPKNLFLCASTLFLTIVIFSVPLYYIAPGITNWIISKCNHLNKI